MIVPPAPGSGRAAAPRVGLLPEVRRELLLARSRALREQIRLDAQVLRTPLALADDVLGGLRWLRQHPVWPLAGLALLVALRPRRLWRWSWRAWWAWGLWQRGARLLAVAPVPVHR